jgi:methylamine dehydrogenase heavy chain
MAQRRRSLVAVGALALAFLGAAATRAEIQIEAPLVWTLPEERGPHWFWLSDIVLRRTALFDADTGSMLGTITSGSGSPGFIIAPLFAPDGKEIYLAETYFSRGVRGERTDVLSVYDGRTLAPVAEVPLPPKRAESYPGNASNALSDDGRLAAVFNLTPATSLSIVDVRERRFVAEVPTPGCSLVFAAGAARFVMMCGNGEALVVDVVGDEGRLTRVPSFFDAQADPITEKAVRRGGEWIFVSFAGVVHPLDVSGDTVRPGERWSLVDDADQRENWRVGGMQHLAVHAASGRLYVLMHQGGPDTHKAPGTEVWVYDLTDHRRVTRIPVLNPFESFLVQQLALGAGTGGSMARWILARTLPNPGVERIAVTQDDQPVLVTSQSLPPTLTVHDATTGAVLREIGEPGLVASLIFLP